MRDHAARREGLPYEREPLAALAFPLAPAQRARRPFRTGKRRGIAVRGKRLGLRPVPGGREHGPAHAGTGLGTPTARAFSE